jgi:hypothetical protein
MFTDVLKHSSLCCDTSKFLLESVSQTIALRHSEKWNDVTKTSRKTVVSSVSGVEEKWK